METGFSIIFSMIDKLVADTIFVAVWSVTYRYKI